MNAALDLVQAIGVLDSASVERSVSLLSRLGLDALGHGLVLVLHVAALLGRLRLRVRALRSRQVALSAGLGRCVGLLAVLETLWLVVVGVRGRGGRDYLLGLLDGADLGARSGLLGSRSGGLAGSRGGAGVADVLFLPGVETILHSPGGALCAKNALAGVLKCGRGSMARSE